MNYQEFGEAYRKSFKNITVAYPDTNQHFDMELVGEFDTARGWNERLGSIVMNHLLDGEKDEDFERDTIDEYVEWASAWAPSMLARVLEKCRNAGVSNRYITDLTFHLAAPAFGAHWHAIADGTHDVDWGVNRATQTSLALASIETMRLRKELAEGWSTLSDPQRQIAGDINSSLVGQSTELDLDLASLEAVALYPESGKLVLPAPRQFEVFNREINIDTIVLDTKSRKAYGLQAKTRLNQRDFHRQYDKRFVTIIEGFGDLGNKSFEVIKNQRVTAVSEPGMLSLRHIARTPYRHIPLSRSFTESDRWELKRTAKNMTAGSRYTVERAGRIIGERLFDSQERQVVSQH